MSFAPLSWDSFIVDTVLLKGTFLLLFGGTLCLALRKSTANLRHLVWCLTFSGLLLVIVLTFLVPKWELSVLPAESQQVPEVSERFEPSDSTTTKLPMLEPPRPARTPERLKSIDWIAAIGTIWILGMVYFLSRILYDVFSLRRLSSRGDGHTDKLHRLLLDCLRKTDLSRSVNLKVTSGVTVPMVWQFRDGTVLLPESAKNWSEDRLELVLLHELSHLKRRDPWTSLFAEVACAVYWMNPLVWLAARRMNIEREQACDEMVLHTGTDRIAYATQLVDIARAMRPVRSSAGVAMAYREDLKHRVTKILQSGFGSRRLSRRTRILALALASAVVVFVASAKLAERKSFSATPSVQALLDELNEGNVQERKKPFGYWASGKTEQRCRPSLPRYRIPIPSSEVLPLGRWAKSRIRRLLNRSLEP